MTLLLGAALLYGATAAVDGAAASCTALALLAVVAAPGRAKWLLGAAILFCYSAYAARAALDAHEQRRRSAADAVGAGAACVGRGAIVRSPTGSARGAVLVVEASELACDGRRVPGLPFNVRLYNGDEELGRGDVLRFDAQLGSPRSFRNSGAGRPDLSAARHGIVLSGPLRSLVVDEHASGFVHGVDDARARVRQRIRATFSEAAAPLARALVLGENDLLAEDQNAFKKSGLAHILAVSGTHLVFAVVMLVQALRYVLVRIEPLAARFDVTRFASAFGVVLSIVYADFAGGSGSAWRAAWMLSAAFAVRAMGRRPDGVRALAVSLVAGASFDALAAFDISFQLSVAATLGLMFVARPASRLAARLRPAPLRYLSLSVTTSASAMICSAPLLALLSGEMTLAGIAANVIAGPLGEALALPLCLAHAMLAPVPALEQGTAFVASGALLVIRRIAHASADATWLAFPVPPPTSWQLGLAVVASVGALRSHASGRARRAVAWWVASAIGLAVLEHSARTAGAPKDVLRVTFLDVGQGDATLVDMPDGSGMLIDAGGLVGAAIDPGSAAVLPLLRARRRRHLDVVVLSHPHPDHYGGLLAVVDSLSIGEFWDTGQGEAEHAGPAYEALLQRIRKRSIPIKRPADLCDRDLRRGAATLRVLAPCPGFTPRVDANDNSFVVRVELGARAALLTGDAEASEEADLTISARQWLAADVLKVGHHGSRTSSQPEFLRAVQPRTAVISCGLSNRFGHPHPEALERLTTAGARVLSTSRFGSVTWWTDGHETSVSSYESAAASAASN
jgi:competence protein ComEC